MQPTRIFSIAAAITILAGPAAARQTSDTLPRLVERDLSGPRFGLSPPMAVFPALLRTTRQTLAKEASCDTRFHS